jgi:hypothetical protein
LASGSGRTTVLCARAGVAMSARAIYLTLLADSEGKAKERDRGLGHLAEAERLVAETEER